MDDFEKSIGDTLQTIAALRPPAFAPDRVIARVRRVRITRVITAATVVGVIGVIGGVSRADRVHPSRAAAQGSGPSHPGPSVYTGRAPLGPGCQLPLVLPPAPSETDSATLMTRHQSDPDASYSIKLRTLNITATNLRLVVVKSGADVDAAIHPETHNFGPASDSNVVGAWFSTVVPKVTRGQLVELRIGRTDRAGAIVPAGKYGVWFRVDEVGADECGVQGSESISTRLGYVDILPG